MQIELKNHLAQARHPVTSKPLFDDNGTPVPLFPQQRSIWLDGVFIGYVCEPPTRSISILVAGTPDAVLQSVEQAVIGEFGPRHTDAATHVVKRIKEESADE